MKASEIIADLVDSPEIRPDSPDVRSDEFRVVTGVSPDSPDSPRANEKNALSETIRHRRERHARDPFRQDFTLGRRHPWPDSFDGWRAPQYQAFVEMGWNAAERRARLARVPKAWRRRVMDHVRTAYAIRQRFR